MKYFKVFKRDFAFKLIREGHLLLDKEPNTKKTWLSVYIFEDTEDFRKAYTRISNGQ